MLPQTDDGQTDRDGKDAAQSTYMEVDVSRAADILAAAEWDVNRKDRLLMGILDHELRQTLAVPEQTKLSLRLIDCLSKDLRLIRHEIGHFGKVLPSQFCGSVLEKITNLDNMKTK